MMLTTDLALRIDPESMKKFQEDSWITRISLQMPLRVLGSN